MFERRNAGCITADFKAGDSLTGFIYDEIKKRKPGWNANELNSLELVAPTDFSFQLEGWTWTTSDGKIMLSNQQIKNIELLTDVSNLRAMFRYD